MKRLFLFIILTCMGTGGLIGAYKFGFFTPNITDLDKGTYVQSRANPEAATGRLERSEVRAQDFMVATANDHASKAGVKLLKAGGSAMDAAIAAQLVLNVVEPQSCAYQKHH